MTGFELAITLGALIGFTVVYGAIYISLCKDVKKLEIIRLSEDEVCPSVEDDIDESGE